MQRIAMHDGELSSDRPANVGTAFRRDTALVCACKKQIVQIAAACNGKLILHKK